MGGVKKRSMASMERQQQSQQSQGGEETKKEKGEKAAPQQQKRLAFLLPKMTDQEMLKSISPLKAITVYSTSRALGINSSVASSLLLSLEGKSLLKRAGGFSGHYVWALP
jgi:small subunit ribosomal protein S25e